MKHYQHRDPNTGTLLPVVVGESAQENWDLIDQSENHHIWFHLDGRPSPHVIIQIPVKIKKKWLHRSMYKFAADLCKQHSRFSSEKNLAVIYTEIKYIKKVDPVGSVICRKTKTIYV